MLALLLGNGRIVRVREARLAVFQNLRHARPELQAVRAAARAAQLRRCALRMRNAAARGHPVDRARLDVLHRADAVAVHELSFEKVGHRRQPDMRVRTDIGVLEGLELLRTEMIEEKERPHGLLFRGRKQAANLEMTHRAQPRLQYQDVSHYYAAA